MATTLQLKTLGRTLAGPADVEAVLREVLRNAIRQSQAETAYLLLTPALQFHCGQTGDREIHAPVDVNASLARQALDGAGSVIVRDAGDGSPRWTLAVPIISSDDIEGLFYLMGDGQGPDDASRTTLETLGDMAAGTLATARLVGQQAHQIETLERAVCLYKEALAPHVVDEVTGLLTRASFEGLFPILWAAAQRYQTPLTVMLVRIEMAAGGAPPDALVAQLGQLLHACCRACDTLSRFSADTFAVLLPHTPEWGATTLADRLRAAWQGLGAENALALHIGIGEMDDTMTCLDLLTAAGAALEATHSP